MRGLQDENKSGLWWHMHRIIGDLRPRIVVIENVANAIAVGGPEVVGSLANIGYNCEWSIISAKQFGAPHLRKRWFCVAYTHGIGWNDRGDTKRKNTNSLHIQRDTTKDQQQRGKWIVGSSPHNNVVTNAHGITGLQTNTPIGTIGGQRHARQNVSWCNRATTIGATQGQTYWQRTVIPESTICTMDDGISRGMDRATRRLHKEQLKALGNAIVPQCSEYIGQLVLQSGLLDDLINQ
jgi:site-specific DNA-cytosine methylase